METSQVSGAVFHRALFHRSTAPYIAHGRQRWPAGFPAFPGQFLQGRLMRSRLVLPLRYRPGEWSELHLHRRSGIAFRKGKPRTAHGETIMISYERTDAGLSITLCAFQSIIVAARYFVGVDVDQNVGGVALQSVEGYGREQPPQGAFLRGKHQSNLDVAVRSGRSPFRFSPSKLLDEDAEENMRGMVRHWGRHRLQGTRFPPVDMLAQQ